MTTLAISKFKATCLAAIEQVRKTGKPLRITRFGKPVADIVPARPARQRKRQLGMMVGTAEILGDIVGPVLEEGEWDIDNEWKNFKR